MASTDKRWYDKFGQGYIKDSNKGSTAKVNVKVLTDMKRMMQHVERAGRELNVWEEDPESWTPAKVTRLYETIQWKFRIPPSKGLVVLKVYLG